MEDSLNRVWKEFGKQTEAGKLLYELYGVRYRPEKFVNYPKPKLKSNLEPKMEHKIQQTSKKISDAVHKIDYPEIKRRNSSYRFNMIDMIPKRKKETEIKKELNEIKKTIENDNKSRKIANNEPFTSRKMKIEKLQDKFMFQQVTSMPRRTRLPGVKYTEDSNEKGEATVTMVPKKKFDHNSRREELDYLYDSILKEIDERYAHMEEVKKLGKDMDMIIMAEIKDRLDELKKIQKMINEYDKELR